MTALEIQIVKALNRCQIWPGTNTHSFIKAMRHKVRKKEAEAYQLSEKQKEFLFDILHRYRNQEPVKELHRQHCKSEACQKKMKMEDLLAKHLEEHPQLVLF